MIEEAPPQDYRKAMRQHAIMLLTRREHAAGELVRKLVHYGYDSLPAKELVEELGQQGLQSDSRFTENYIRFRREKGFGPLRIQQELQERGISDTLINDNIDAHDEQWMQTLRKVRSKRFGDAIPTAFAERGKQSQFLNYRGFSAEQIAQLLDTELSD